MSTPEAASSVHEARVMHLFLARGLIAIAWAVVFMAVAGSHTTVTGGMGVLLVLYPLIDVVGSLIDAQGQHGPARRLLLANVAVSVIAAVALALAATGTVANVLVVFGAWALLTVRRNSSSRFAVAHSWATSGPC